MVSNLQALVADRSDILAEARIVYLILHVHDLAESRAFYEKTLGLCVVEADEDSVKFDAGLVMLALYRASDYGVELMGRCDDASDIVFLVDDINLTRAALEARGVTFVRRRTYEIGLVTDFYDPNGHRLMIYQPSQVALTWPSAEKLRAVWRACGKGGDTLIGPAAAPASAAAKEGVPSGLDGKPLVYLFLFVPLSYDALAFYRDALGLRLLENVHCCNPACPPEELGIAKYDAGGMLLTSHHVHKTAVVDDFGRIYSPREVDPAHTKGIVPVFQVSNIAGVVEQLAARGVEFDGPVVRSQIGEIAKFVATTGHTFYLYEPAPAALLWPSGKQLQATDEIMRATMQGER